MHKELSDNTQKKAIISSTSRSTPTKRESIPSVCDLRQYFS